MKPTHFARGMIVAGMMSCSGLAHGQSITDALTTAHSNSPDLESALLGAKGAAENIVQAKSGKLPKIAASLGGTYGGTLTQDGFSDSTQLSAGLQYNQTIFDNFRTDAQIEAARAGAEAAEHQIRNAELNVLLSVVQTYMQVLTGRQILTLRAESLDFFRAQLSSAQDRLEVGEGTRIDVAQARARLAQGEATYQAAANSLEISAATFQRHVGAAPGSLSASHNFARLIPADLATAISSAEAAHPAILMAKASIRGAQASSDVAQAASGPTASITGQVGTSITNPGGFQGVDGRIGFNITVPIYSGGSMGAGVRQANIEQIQSEVDAMSAYDQIREAVISAWAGIQSADAQITAATAAASAGQEVLSGVIQERDLGTRTTLDVLNAQAEVITARETQINASSNKVLATFSLLAAMGRLTAQDLNLPVTIKTAAPYTQAVEDVWQELRAIAE